MCEKSEIFQNRLYGNPSRNGPDKPLKAYLVHFYAAAAVESTGRSGGDFCTAALTLRSKFESVILIASLNRI